MSYKCEFVDISFTERKWYILNNGSIRDCGVGGGGQGKAQSLSWLSPLVWIIQLSRHPATNEIVQPYGAWTLKCPWHPVVSIVNVSAISRWHPDCEVLSALSLLMPPDPKVPCPVSTGLSQQEPLILLPLWTPPQTGFSSLRSVLWNPCPTTDEIKEGWGQSWSESEKGIENRKIEFAKKGMRGGGGPPKDGGSQIGKHWTLQPWQIFHANVCSCVSLCFNFGEFQHH